MKKIGRHIMSPKGMEKERRSRIQLTNKLEMNDHPEKKRKDLRLVAKATMLLTCIET